MSSANTRSIDDGSGTHVRYSHGSGITKVALRCPRCGGEALATLPSYAKGVLIIGDLSPEFRGSEWHVACLACPHRAGPFSYEQMRAHAPLYFDLGAAGDDLWAWNREHLEMVAEVLEGHDVSGNRLVWFATYIPGRWMRRRKRYAQLARRALAGEGIG